MDIEEKMQILDELFIVYDQVSRFIVSFNKQFETMQKDFFETWSNNTRSLQQDCFLLAYDNFVNAVKNNTRNCFTASFYPEDLVEMCFLENHLRNIILKLTGFIKQKSDFCEEEKLEQTTTNPDFEPKPSIFAPTQN